VLDDVEGANQVKRASANGSDDTSPSITLAPRARSVASAGTLISTNCVASSGNRGRRPGATSSCRRDPGSTELTSGQVLKRWGSTRRAPDHSRS
jgi:hypothetical protein